MNSIRIAFYVVAAELAALAIVVPGAALAAQPAEEPAIVVEAPRTLPSPLPASPGEKSPFTGAQIVTTVVRISVLYGDLDLKQPESAARLMTRIQRVAHDACVTLDRLYPLSPDPDCVSRAAAKATPAAKALLAAEEEK
ncbi:UrcA family protein [Novosphingobium sp. G106]|uniref:UrcA family protein n=1 Tax=Novosphingobium sp. G106 TaxID=2849500 RepID=UPI001C2DA6E8|nr:UrcA family protein [Novosphingobium sp. G106]MBV1691952.1 UrcA family protein [Novosphingobium sp. G106]